MSEEDDYYYDEEDEELDMNDFQAVARDIMYSRQLPYTLVVEKIEGNIIWTHNQWGNSVMYRRNDDGTYDVIGADE